MFVYVESENFSDQLLEPLSIKDVVTFSNNVLVTSSKIKGDEEKA